MLEGVAGEEVHGGGGGGVRGAGGQSKCEGDERGVGWEELNNFN